MEEAWERAVETALEGADPSSSPPRTLTLDGVVKCLHGRMPPPSLLERFQTLEHLSLANIGLASLEKFPKLRRLQRLILSDNRISGGLEFLVDAGLGSLRDLDLSNNRIQFLEDLSPLAELKLVSLDLYECPVTRIGDYRAKVFGLIRSLKYLDKMDAEENERPESDEEEEEDDEEEEDEDPGNGEVDGDERVAVNGIGNSGCGGDGVVDLYEDEESDCDADEEEAARGERRANGFRVALAGEELVEDEDAEDEEYVEDEDEDLGEEVDEEGGDGDEDVVEVHEIEDSEEDGVEEEEDDEEDVEEDDEDLEDGDEDLEPSCAGRLIGAEGEIDGHEQGEEDENGEIGEENGDAVEDERDFDVEDGEDEDEYESEYLVQPIRQPEGEASGSDLDAGSDEDDSEEEVDDEDNHVDTTLPSSLSKRKRDDEDNDNKDGLNDDSVEDSRSSKHR